MWIVTYLYGDAAIAMIVMSCGDQGGSRIFERGASISGADTGFPEGGGGGGEDIHKHPPPPLDIVRVTSSVLRKIEKHPHSWTFTSTHSDTPGPWTLSA